jgi:hypothetical protein
VTGPATPVFTFRFPTFTFPELKGIDSSLIHFEAAIEALLIENMLDFQQARSNWLFGDWSATCGKNRSESVEVTRQVSNHNDITCKIQTDARIKNFCWNFAGLEGLGGMIEFRKPPGGLRSNKAFCFQLGSVHHNPHTSIDAIRTSRPSARLSAKHWRSDIVLGQSRFPSRWSGWLPPGGPTAGRQELQGRPGTFRKLRRE